MDSNNATYRGPEESPHYVRAHLDPTRIRLQRERLGITGKTLAERIQVTPSAISQIERGVIDPDYETLTRLGFALKVPVHFFLDRDTNVRIDLDRCHFRSKRGVPQYKRRQSIGDASLLVQLAKTLKSDMGIRYPEEALSGFTDDVSVVDQHTPIEEMEELALALRQHWEMGLGPIPNLVALLESKGILVFPLADVYDEVDAFSVWEAGIPVVLLAQNKAASRDRLDAAHELCHLALHSDAERDIKAIEDQAFRFGGAFLAPRESFLPECPTRWNRRAFLDLKRRWKMSMQALVRRAYDLGQLSESSYRRANIDLRKRFARTGKEEGEWKAERPVLVEQALELIQGDFSLKDLAFRLGIHTSDLRSLLTKVVSQDAVTALDSTQEKDKSSFELPRVSRESTSTA